MRKQPFFQRYIVCQVLKRKGNVFFRVKDYENSVINLNATSMQMQTAVNQRVFDVPASGGFLITDAQADALEHFEPGKEIITYESAEELQDKALYFEKNESERKAIVQAAQKRVHDCHTYKHRLSLLIERMRERHQ